MDGFVGYIIMFLFVALCFGIYVFLLALEKKRISKYYEKEKEKVLTLKEFLLLSKKIEAKEKDLKKYPNLSIYLLQAEAIINEHGFNLENIEISTMKKIPEKDLNEFDKIKFSEEYVKARKNIRDMVDTCSELLGRIYYFNHPIKYSMIEFKKNIYLQILRFLVWLVRKMSNKSEQVIK